MPKQAVKTREKADTTAARSPQSICWLHQQLNRPLFQDLLKQLQWSISLDVDLSEFLDFDLSENEAIKLANAPEFELDDANLDQKRKALFQGLAAAVFPPVLGTLYFFNDKGPCGDKYRLEGHNGLTDATSPDDDKSEKFWLAKVPTELRSEALSLALQIAKDLWCGECQHVAHHPRLGLRDQRAVTKHLDDWDEDCVHHRLASYERSFAKALRGTPRSEVRLELFVEEVVLHSEVGLLRGSSIWGLADLAKLNARQIEVLRSGMLLYRIHTASGSSLEIVPLPICSACGREVSETNRCDGAERRTPRDSHGHLKSHLPEIGQATPWLVRQDDRIEGGQLYRCPKHNDRLFFGLECPICQAALNSSRGNSVTNVWVPLKPESSNIRRKLSAIVRDADEDDADEDDADDSFDEAEKRLDALPSLLDQLDEQQLNVAIESFDSSFVECRFPPAKRIEICDALESMRGVLNAYKDLAIAVRELSVVLEGDPPPTRRISKEAMNAVMQAKNLVDLELDRLEQALGRHNAAVAKFAEYLFECGVLVHD